MLAAGSFLVDIARDRSLPLEVRRRAVWIARHFPTIEDVAAMANPQLTAIFGSTLVHPSEVVWADGYSAEPFTTRTRLTWPDEAA
jgi:hypothetical protein